MRQTRATWRTPRITIHFATIKAMTYLALMHGSPVVYTELVLERVKKRNGYTTHNITYRMVLEALHELEEQGLACSVGSVDGGYWWYSTERVI